MTVPPSSAVYHVVPTRHPLDAVVHVPGSKSIANRALVCATLADGVSELHNVPGGDDTAAMLECVALLGAGVEGESTVHVHGTNGVLREGPMVLSTRLAGTTSRFVTALCALGTGHYEVDGLGPLRSRPMGPLHDALVTLGAEVTPGEAWGHLPVTIGGMRNRGGRGSATSGPSRLSVRGDVSSQFITALMLIGPYLPGGVLITLTTPLVSRPYVAITTAVMASFGVADITVAASTIRVPPGQYHARVYTIEPDASSASYPLAAAAICGGSVRVADLGPRALQGDAAFADVLERMGCTVVRDDLGTVVRRTGEITGVTIDMAGVSDLVPSLAVVAPFATTATEITGVGFIRAKESDRIGDLARELRKCGVDVVERADGIRIQPGAGSGAAVDTHHDHRLAMAFGVIGLRLGGVRVHDPEVVAKSWPGFWTMLESLRSSG